MAVGQRRLWTASPKSMRVHICAQHSYDSCMRYLVLDVMTSEEALAVSCKQ